MREWGERQRPRERQLFFWERKGRMKGRKPQVIFERKEEWREKESKAAEKKTGENRGGRRKKKKRERGDRSSNRGGIETKTEKKRPPPPSNPEFQQLPPLLSAAATATFNQEFQQLPPLFSVAATENSRQHHRQLSHPRSAPQVNSLSPLAAGPNSSSCLQNVHCARSACKKKIISRLLCMRTVTGYMGFFPSPVGWNISPARAAGLSPAPFCFGLEHQPSPRGWAESNLVAGPIQAQPSPFHFISFLLFVLCVFLLSIYIFWKLWFSHGFFYVISTNIGFYFYILKIQIQY